MHESSISNGTVSSRDRGSEGKVNRVTMITLVVVLVGVCMYLHVRFERLERRLDDLATRPVDAPERPSPELAESAKRPPITAAPPSKNPASDVTGSSARSQKRRARVSDCQRVCRQLISCVSSKTFCSALPTHGQQEAIQTCAHVCERETAVRAQLLARTGCEETSLKQLPTELHMLCSK